MPNWVPYAVLVLVSFLLGFIAWRKVRSATFFFFYFGISGAILFFEFFIFNLFHSYVYKVGLLEDPLFDSILGSVVSNALIVPSVALIIAIFGLNFYWVIGMALLFMGIETAFIHFDWYETNWWRTYYTGLGMVIYFTYAKWMWKLKTSKWPRLFLLFSGASIFHTNLTTTYSICYFYRIHREAEIVGSTRFHMNVDIMYSILIGLLVAVFVLFKIHIPVRVLVLFLLFGVYWGATLLGYVTLAGAWVPFLLSATDVLTLLMFSWFNKKLLQDT